MGLTIWHNEDEDERYELTQEVELFGVDEGTGRVTASLEVSAGVYEMTLGLTDGETTAERPLRLEVLPPALAIVSSSALSSGRVTVSSDAVSGHSALTVTLRGGTNAAFLSSSASGLTATGGGDEAVVSLTASAIELFTLDGLELSLALTASDADESSTVTVRFASSPRGFDGAALRELIRTTALGSGTEVFAASDAKLTIWHNDDGDEEYSLEGVGSELFTAGSDGAVRSAGELEVGSGKSYALTLILRDGEASARPEIGVGVVAAGVVGVGWGDGDGGVGCGVGNGGVVVDAGVGDRSDICGDDSERIGDGGRKGGDDLVGERCGEFVHGGRIGIDFDFGGIERRGDGVFDGAI